MTDDEFKELLRRMRPSFRQSAVFWFTFAVGAFLGTLLGNIIAYALRH